MYNIRKDDTSANKSTHNTQEKQDESWLAQNIMYSKISNINLPFLFAFLYCIFILIACFALANSEIKNYERWTWEFITQQPTTHKLKDIAVNVVFFVPLGVFIALAKVPSQRKYRITSWILFGALFSSIIELFQPYFGRYSDPYDLISNAVGYVSGYLIIVYSINKLRQIVWQNKIITVKK